MRCYTKEEIIELKNNGFTIKLDSFEKIDDNDLFVEQRRSELNNNISILELQLINRDEIKNVRDYLNENGEISEKELAEKFNITKANNNSINALLQKGILKEENGVFKISD